MAGSVTVEWHGRPIQAVRPDLIADLTPELQERTIRRTEQAAAAVQRAASQGAGALEPSARLLLRAEGLASSAIEGIRAPVGEVARAEVAEGGVDRGSPAAWVADNLAVVTDALAQPGALDQERLFAWHRRLMANSPTIDRRHVGAYRDVLGWVGGPTPLVAAHVAAVPEQIPELMDDLFAFVARDDIDPVSQAGLAHAEFETIHPFADGNGRLGRVLIGRILSQRLTVAVPPPVSLNFARDIGGYLSGLTLYRQGFFDRWVGWFADCVTSAAETVGGVLLMVDELQRSWRAATGELRADSSARRLVELLPAHPVVSAHSVAELLGVSEQAARTALHELVRRRVLVEMGEIVATAERTHDRGRPRRWWEADGLLALLGP